MHVYGWNKIPDHWRSLAVISFNLFYFVFQEELELTNCKEGLRNRLAFPPLQWKQSVQRGIEYKGCLHFEGALADRSPVQRSPRQPSEVKLETRRSETREVVVFIGAKEDRLPWQYLPVSESGERSAS